MKIHTYDEYWNQGWAVAAFPRLYPMDKVVEMKEWCRSIYGEPGLRWKDQIEYGEVLFYNYKDLTLFLLKWAD